MITSRFIVLAVIFALFGASLAVMGFDAAPGHVETVAQVHCDTCDDTTHDHAEKPHAGDCASGASCLINAVTVLSDPIVIMREAAAFRFVAENETGLSTRPRLDLPPPRLSL